MTPETTAIGTSGSEHSQRFPKNRAPVQMVYKLGESQLLSLSGVIRYLEVAREAQDPRAWSYLLTIAQMYLTAFALELEPSFDDYQPNSPTGTTFD